MNYTSLKSVRIFFNIQDDNILKKDAAVEMTLRIVASLCQIFLQQGIQVSCYGNGVDIVTHSPLNIPPKAGQGQMDAVYRGLARIDVEQPAANFPEIFEEMLFQKAQGSFTYFVAPNRYDDFVELLTRYRDAGNPFLWFYPSSSGRDPELPPALEQYIDVVRFEE